MNFLKQLVALTCISVNGVAGGVEGFVKNADNTPIEFATIYVKELGTGATTNVEGHFQINLEPGSYNLVFQHLGYKARELKVEIGNSFKELDVILSPESIVLRSVVVQGVDEDPAYTIMRKAISKAKYHTQQLDSFEVEVYIKGSGRLIDSPFFFRKAIEKEGIDSTTSYATESVSRVKYKRPNTYEEEVVSVRSTGDDYGTGPNSFILGSFYSPKYVDAISPLSPKAFAYYKFEYLGTKNERGYEISKIKVIPRSRGDEVFWGELSIVEEDWSIQSTNLTMQKLGLQFNVKQIYEPIERGVWLPISHKFDVTGKIFGFRFEYEYLSTMGKYKIVLNKDLAQQFEIIDETLEKDLAKELNQKPKDSLEQKLAEGGELTRKQFRKLINSYEKEEAAALDEPMVVDNFTYTIDSLAATADSTYWEQIRPVPLTEYEKKGYYKIDSAIVAQKREAEGDTLESNKHDNFRPYDILLGYNFKFGEKDRLKYYPPWTLLNFNSVEGYIVSLKFKYAHTFANKTKLFIWPEFKYGFSSKQFYSKGSVSFNYGPLYRRGKVHFTGGKYTKQLNIANPIHPLVNTFTTLVFHDNYMKLYESGYMSISHEGYFSDRLSYSMVLSFEKRTPLQNTTTHGWFNTSKEYTSNSPKNIEQQTTDFIENKALLFDLGLEYKPWLKFKIRNGVKQAINSSSPVFSVIYNSGVPTAQFKGADFSKMEVGVKHGFKPGIRGQFFINAQAGKFFDKPPSIFIDFKHFDGNESPFLMEDPVGSYRLLPYYFYSTSDQYVTGQMLYQFRKFLFTQWPLLRLTGVKELAYISYLATPSSGNYIELGYGFDNLFRILRAEVATSFIDGKYNSIGFKIGIATSVTTGDGSLNIGF